MNSPLGNFDALANTSLQGMGEHRDNNKRATCSPVDPSSLTDCSYLFVKSFWKLLWQASYVMETQVARIRDLIVVRGGLTCLLKALFQIAARETPSSSEIL